MNKEKAPYAIVAITRNGLKIAKKLQKGLGNADVFYKRKYGDGEAEEENITPYDGNSKDMIPVLFQSYQGCIFIFSLGAAVRLMAPYVKDKKTDPAVVVVDDHGQFAISALSGHLGGANELTERVANILQAVPVITTASDRQKTLAVDILGRSFGWSFEPSQYLTAVSAAVVNDGNVAIIQESGEKEWWQREAPLPANLKLYRTIDEAADKNNEAFIIITHRILEKEIQQRPNLVIYRPKVIALGIGCNRGTSQREIEEVIDHTLSELNFSKKSVKAICTIDIKKDEPGLIETAEKHGWEFHYYPPEQLNTVKLKAPSETVYKYTGAYGVSEAAVKLYSGAEKLSVVKKKSGNVTISVAIIPFS